jgi:hypothetical protein
LDGRKDFREQCPAASRGWRWSDAEDEKEGMRTRGIPTGGFVRQIDFIAGYLV